MTSKKYRQYNIYYTQLTHAIAGHKLYEVSYESVYREMEKLLLGMIIIAADIDDSKGDLDKLGRYIDHLIDEYEKGNDELYMMDSMRKPQTDKVARGPGTGESMAVRDFI